MKTDSRRFKSLSTLIFFALGMLFSAKLVGAFFHPGFSLERVSKARVADVSARYLAHESEIQDETTFRLNLTSEKDDVRRHDIKEVSYFSLDAGPFDVAAGWESTSDTRHVQGKFRSAGHNLHGTRQVQLIVKEIGNAEDQVFK